MSNPTPTLRQFDHLVYLRIFEGCNLKCKHCFIPANPKKIDLEKIKDIPSLLNKKISKGSKILLQWHGGEPTLLGKKYLEQAIHLIEEHGTDYEWIHGIQTNLVNFDESWVSLYKNHFDNEIGVSWDPIIRRYDTGDESTQFERFNSIFWKNIELVQKNDINIYLVMTATKTFFQYFKNPFDLFELLKKHGIKQAHLERVTKTGYARENWQEIGLNHLEYSQYMSKFYKAYILWNENNPENRLSLSPFDGLKESVETLIKARVENTESDIHGYGCWSGSCDTTFHTIDSNGYKAGCTAITSEYDNPRVDSASPIIWFGKNQKQILAQRQERVLDCNTCQFKPICSSGCMANAKVDESGECSGSYRLFKTIEQTQENYY
jgi:radical SAM protein with 4Fe4S-binding SPASM domain